jgi:diguanylate cyclase (GGDEF)-like protein
MESASTPARGQQIDSTLLSAGVQEAASAAKRATEPKQAIDDAVGALYDAIDAIYPALFVLEHGRLWVVAQRGYAVVPDGIRVEQGIMGRAVRIGHEQFTPNVHSDPDYLGALPGVSAELAIPLRVGEAVVGVLNVESERPLPESAAELVRPLAAVLAPLAEALRVSRTLDLAALARLFVHLGGLRDPEEIAGLAAASLSKVLPIDMSQVVVWNEHDAPVELVSWRSDDGERRPLSELELGAARALVDPNVVCQLLDIDATPGARRRLGSLVWVPLRTSGTELGAIVAAIRPDEVVDPEQLDTAAVLAAHVAASLDTAAALQLERRSAVTDSLTGILNRRGLEQELERELGVAQEMRKPLSVLVIDCDDFKEINDRAGHEFGDTLLYQIGRVLLRALPLGAEAARLGGDEFVVMLPGADADLAAALGSRLRGVLAEGLTEAGFPLRVSAGIATYPFDGASSSSLLRAADQALYAAKNAGKDRIASFADVARPDPLTRAGDASEGRRRARGEGPALAEVVSAALAIDAETTPDGVCSRLCKWLVFVVGATACSASRLVGDLVIDSTKHALREVSLGDEASYRLSDFPVTAETLETGEPRAVSFLDGDVDPAEAFILRELGMNAVLLLPLHVAGKPWGLVELYEMRLRRFTDDDLVVARFLVAQAERRLAALGAETAPFGSQPVYELPPEDLPRGPRTR